MSLALHGVLLAIAVALSSTVAARHAAQRVKLTFVEEQHVQPVEQQQENSPPPSPGPPPPPRRVFVRKMAPPPDLPPAPPAPAAPVAEQLPAAPPPCTDPRGCNQNPGAVGGVEGGTGIPGGTGTGTGHGGGPPRPMYLSPGMTRPRLLSGDQPHYTDQARRARVEGDVIVRIEVRQDGSVGEVKILSGLALLEQEVVSKIRRWRFSSPTYRGQPVSLYLIQRITFRLED